MKYSNLLLVLPAMLMLSLTAMAQEESPIIEGPDPAHREIHYDEDKTLLYDQPLQTQAPGVRDSTIVAPKPVSRTIRTDATREGQKPRTEDDALRFNFLYYIIQKYKISDIIEN